MSVVKDQTNFIIEKNYTKLEAILFQNKDPIFQLKKDLMVDYILKGSIINIDDQIKINTMLIETANESIVWSDTYVRKIDNILELQIELAKDIINNLSVKKTSDEKIITTLTNQTTYIVKKIDKNKVLNPVNWFKNISSQLFIKCNGNNIPYQNQLIKF